MRQAIESSTLEGRASKKLPQGVKVIDVDVHLHESPKAIMPYCEMPWRKSLELLSTLPKGSLDIPYYCPAITVWTPPFPPTGGDRRHTVTSATQMRKDLNEMSVDVGVIFPDHYLQLPVLRDVSYATALARAYNRWLTDEWLGADNGLKGAVLVAPQNPVAAAEEIRRYAGHKNAVAICLPASCLETLYGHRCYDPLYDAAQETGLPVMLHSAGAVFPVFPFNTNCFSTVFSVHIVSHAFSMMANLLSMMETGVPARFPKLKIGFVEAGFAWRPWMMLRMDKEFAERRREMPYLAAPPSTYVRQMFFATQPIEEPENMGDLATLLSLFGGQDSVMFASDWPHHDFDHPNKILQIPVSPEVQRKLLSGNAMRFLNLEESAS